MAQPADQLEKHPVKIYNWVRNNIEFIPSYGSIQGADMTLQNKRGNAFDTASLLIALYRASGIPARYVYGTIEVSVEKVMNWVGGGTKPEAAQSLLGQGGIPNVGLIAGGTVKAIRMEHVWVEAYVDYTPGRGAVNRNPTTWVPMDASFKQYRFTSGMDIKANVPLDSQSLLDSIKQGATIDETQGYAQNLNTANLQSQLTNYQTQVQNYVNSQKANATVGDVLGTHKVIEQSYAILLGSLPYKTVATGNRFQALPDKLKWKFKTNIYAGGWYGDASSPYIEINQPTAKLAGRKITLSFVPATQADQDLINSYMPKPHADGTPIQLTELPTSLPGYLLKMKAEFRIGGQVVAQSTDSFTMGSEVRQANQYFNPASQSWQGGEDNDITVGEYNVIGLDLQGIEFSNLGNLQTKLQSTAKKLLQYKENLLNLSAIADLSTDDLTGDILNSGILGYFAQVDTTDRLNAMASNSVISYRLPSYGRFFTEVSSRFWFGIARSVTFPGFSIDVDYLFQHAEAKDNSSEKRAQFVRQIGASGSGAEHSIPEQFFRNPYKAADDPTQPQAVSAVRALAVAASQGQKIYTFNSANSAIHNTVYNLNISSGAKTEIINALADGKEVTVHEADIVINTWKGSGYVILDPDTGAGAYKIDGGANGGSVQSCAALVAIAVATVIIAMIIAVILLPFIIEAVAGAAAVAGSIAPAIKVAVAALLTSFATYAAAGTSNGGGGGVLCGRDSECQSKLDSDDALCVAIAGPRYGAVGIRICQSAAMQRYSECLRDGVSGIRTPLTGVDTGI